MSWLLIGAVLAAPVLADPPEREEQEHAPRHGGYFGDADDIFHYELVLEDGNQLTFYVSSDHNEPINVAKMHARWTADPGESREPFGFFHPTEDGSAFKTELPWIEAGYYDLDVAVAKDQGWVAMEFQIPRWTKKPTEKLTIFSSRKEPLIGPVIKLFEKETGITTVLKTGKSPVLTQQILNELPNPTADLYIGKESGSLEFLRMKGALAPFTSLAIEQIPAAFRARDNSWIGISGRARAILYNQSLVKPNEVPTTLDELLDPKWKGKIAAVNSGNESLVAWISALRLTRGEAATHSWLEGMKDNAIALLSASHTDVRKAVGRGEYPIGIINHYYYHLQRKEQNLKTQGVGIRYPDQGQGEPGTLINVSGAGIIKGAKQLTSARRFLDFLASPKAQALFAEVNFEYPLRADVQTHPEVLKSIGCKSKSVLDCLKAIDVPLDALGPAMEKTHKLLDEVNWSS